MITIKVEKLFHRNEPRLALRFPKDAALQQVVRTLPDARFSATHRCWYINNRPNRVTELFKLFKGKAYLDVTALRRNTEADLKAEGGSQAVARVTRVREATPHPDQRQALQLVEQKLKLKGYSASTQKTYLEQFSLFMRFFPGSHPADLGEEEIEAYLLYLVDKKKVAKNTQNQAINARAGIRKNVHLHMLRHSFATHLLEAGTSTRYIQVLLGHESPKTTEIYAQVTRFGLDKVVSPLDQIVQSKKLRGDD
ncbi:MAG: phage integrase N-terminal SAM-like domain-containing protein [Cyclobacteriaceae bacterium]